jgi:hypothetical protein
VNKYGREDGLGGGGGDERRWGFLIERNKVFKNIVSCYNIVYIV